MCQSIQEILLISQFAPHVDVYRRNGEDGATWSYSQYGPGENFMLECIDVPLSMDEIYQSINLDEPLLEDQE